MLMHRRRAVVATAAGIAILASIGTAGAASHSQGNSSAVITGTFSDDCQDFEGHSSKDISHVVVDYVDPSKADYKDDSVNSPDYVIDGDDGDELKSVTIKSGTTTETFTCEPSEPKPECSDDVDNADPEDTLADEADPGCHTDGDATNTGSYDPNDNDETDEAGPAPQCSDDVDNADPEDTLADEADPGCHTDGDATNTGSYDPNDNDETDQATGTGSWTCRASVLRLQNSPLGALLGDPFEPLVANAADDPCADEDGGLIDTGETLTAPGFGTLRIRVLHAATSDDNGADASSGVANVTITDAVGAEILHVGVANAEAAGRCSGGNAVLSGSSEVVSLRIMGQGAAIPSDSPEDYDLGPLGVLHLNWQDSSAGVLTQRAVFLEGSPLGDLIIAEAIADFSGDPC
jgi:hypothetical protein